MTTTDPAVSLWDGVESFDAEAVDRALSDLLRDLPLQRAVNEVILPFLQEIGDRWESGTLSVAHEHFFTGLLTRRLSTLATSTTTRREGAPVVVLGCPPGERHEIALLCFGLLLGEQGCRVRYLGADTPCHRDRRRRSHLGGRRGGAGGHPSYGADGARLCPAQARRAAHGLRRRPRR